MVLRRCLPGDLAYVIELERKFHALGFVGADDFQVHETRLADPDALYLLVLKNAAPAGYAILRGLASYNRSIELKRFVIAEPGHGLGRQALKVILHTAFREYAAHRFWLDVFEDNARARHLYRSIGLVEEGLLRQCVRRGDQYRSLLVMSMLENEYLAP